MIQILIFILSQIIIYQLIKLIDREELLNIYKNSTKKENILCIILYCIIGIFIFIVQDIYYTLFLSIFLFGCIQDIKTQYVSDLFQYLNLIVVIIHFFRFPIYQFSFMMLFPFIFIGITWKMRGSADSIAMIIWSIFYLSIFPDSIYILIGFLLSYVIQIVIQTVNCIIFRYSWKDKPVMAFFPALTIGMSFMYVLKI